MTPETILAEIPLPKPELLVVGLQPPGVFTADQLRAYGQAVALEVARDFAQMVAPENIAFSDTEWAIRCEIEEAIRERYGVKP